MNVGACTCLPITAVLMARKINKGSGAAELQSWDSGADLLGSFWSG